MAVDPRVERHYECIDEDGRLWEGGRGDLVRLRTWDLFARLLPAAGVVLDVGAGREPTRRTSPGGATRSCSSSPWPTTRPRRRPAPGKGHGTGFAVVRGEAGHLPVDDHAVDVVLLMGPLYHLVDRPPRLEALAEAWRVLRPDGLLLAEVITRHAWVLDATLKGVLDRPGIWDSFDCNLHRGLAQDPATLGDGGFWAYFHSPDELRRELVDAGFAEIELVAVESFGWLLGDLDERLAVQADHLLAALRLTEREPSMLGVSAHVLGVARPQTTNGG